MGENEAIGENTGREWESEFFRTNMQFNIFLEKRIYYHVRINKINNNTVQNS